MPKYDSQIQEHDNTSPNTKEVVTQWLKKHKRQLIIAGVTITVFTVGVIFAVKKDELEKVTASIAKNIFKGSDTLSAPLPATEGGTKLELPQIPVEVTPPESATAVRSYTPPTEPIDVRSHLRNLPVGKHHSAAKAAEVAELGITLRPDQTWVDSYTKPCA